MDSISYFPKELNIEVTGDFLISNDTYNSVILPTTESCSVGDVVFIVDVGKSNLGLNERQFIRSQIGNPVHDTLGIKDKLNLSILVHNWWNDVLQYWSNMSVESDSAII
jgi:hypothetical protein